jgi:hypothetical protein
LLTYVRWVDKKHGYYHERPAYLEFRKHLGAINFHPELSVSSPFITAWFTNGLGEDEEGKV